MAVAREATYKVRIKSAEWKVGIDGLYRYVLYFDTMLHGYDNHLMLAHLICYGVGVKKYGDLYGHEASNTHMWIKDGSWSYNPLKRHFSIQYPIDYAHKTLNTFAEFIESHIDDTISINLEA